MESIVQFLEAMPSWQRTVAIFASLGAALLFETILPLHRFRRSKTRHVGFNLVFLVTTGIVSFGLAHIAFTLLKLDQWRFGLLYLLNLPLWLQLILSLLLLDFFGQYFIHVLLHRYKWLWKLHLVHHSDTTVDASTGTRHHPGDFLVRESLIVLVIIAAGIPIAFYVLYRIITPLFAYLTHANVNIPVNIDRMLSWIVVTPHMHKVHHHFERPWTNSNYGNILSIWDRLFGTFAYAHPDEIVYGVDTLDDAEDMNLAYQFGLPLNKRVRTDY